MSIITKQEVEKLRQDYKAMLQEREDGNIDSMLFFIRLSMIANGLFDSLVECVERAERAEAKLTARKSEDWITGRVASLINRAWDGDMSDSFIEECQAIEDKLARLDAANT